jgi:response regulator NasT
VAVVTDSPNAARHLTRVLRDSGWSVRPFALTGPSACDRVRELQPTVVLVRADASDLSAVVSLARIAPNGRPALVLLTEQACAVSLKVARESGAAVHLVEPVTTEALVAAVWLSAARARDLWELKQELISLRESFESRKAVERAKAILMRRFGLTEDQAHRRLQQESRNRNRKLSDTAWHVIKADGELRRSRALGPPETESAFAS